MCEEFQKAKYPERLHEFKLPSIERHCFRVSLITVNKLFHCYLNLPAEEFLRTVICR